MRAWLSAASLAGTAAILIGGTALWLERPALSADHLDPPERTNHGSTSDVAADIADVYTWHDDASIVVAVSGAGPQAQGVAPIYDRDVLTRVHLSNDGDATSDEAVIDVRYGRNATGDWGVEFRGIPGASGAVSGPVQTALADGTTVKAEAGLFDDPFFFDLQGFNDTKSSGTLSITSTRNFFAGKNDTSFIVQFPRAAFDRGKPITLWAETRRISAGVS